MKAGALLLFPGAGSSSTHPSLVAIEQAVAPLPVSRADFPYRKAGRSAPDRPPVLLQTVRDEAVALVQRAGIKPAQLVLGGRSMGGRICSMAVAAKLDHGVADDAPRLPAAGLVLISYPLHPPGQPAKLRVDHFPDIAVPCLFISGTRDTFGTPDELTAHTAQINAPVTHVWIEGRGHDLKGSDAAISEAVVTWLRRRPRG